MPRFVRSSVFALGAALGVAAACAAFAAGRASPLGEAGEAARPGSLVCPRGTRRPLAGPARCPRFVASRRRALRTGRLRRRARGRRRRIALGLPRSDRPRAVRPRPLEARGVGNAARNQPRRFRSRAAGRSASPVSRRYWTLRGGRSDARNLNRSDADDGARQRRMDGPENATAAVDAPEALPMLWRAATKLIIGFCAPGRSMGANANPRVPPKDAILPGRR